MKTLQLKTVQDTAPCETFARSGLINTADVEADPRVCPNANA